ncbi:uncharacterized protein P884DRAFT_318384, partial [Thermothelomyces heterothallicus CBS 202.75]|uniref:uncharacterized protein n=1 Tax=Thermothelomyces heterothallicus CBS 202.75 TaxID=1149848 RepID=UPI0037445128
APTCCSQPAAPWQARPATCPCWPLRSSAQERYVVSGANVGLGFEAAKHLARIGVRRDILGVRTLVKGRAVKLAIDRPAGMASTNNKSHVWPLEMAQPASVRAFARRAFFFFCLPPQHLTNETGMQKHTWEVIAMELEAIEPGCVGKVSSGLD